jgi:SAM-dependent methyltransferase
MDVVAALSVDRSLWRSFAARTDAAERLDALLLLQPAYEPEICRLQQQLEAADARLFTRLRARIRRGMFTPAGLRRSLWRHALPRDNDVTGYSPLDVLLAGLFDAGELPDELPSEPEMVAYQPAPGRVILSLLDELRSGDTFYDIGAGLGRVVIAVALLSDARAIGVEFQPSFCAYAARAAESVHARCAFVAADARAAAVEDGTLFFLYTPFRGELLRSVLAKLQRIAARGPIRVCSFGPCTPTLAEEPWLSLQRGRVSPDDLAVFVSV